MLADLNEVLLQHQTEQFYGGFMRLRRDADGWYAVLSVGGHPSPLLLRDAAPSRAAARALIGVIEGHVHREHPAPAAGRRVVLYTDGVPDGRRDSEVYGDSVGLAAGRTAPTRRRSSEGLAADVVDFQRECRATTSRCWPSASPPPDRRASGSARVRQARRGPREPAPAARGRGTDDAHGTREAFPALGVEVAAPDGRLGGLGAAGEQPADDARLHVARTPVAPAGAAPSITQQRPSG